MKSKQFGHLFILLSGFVFLAPATAIAGTDSGIYFGGGFGSSTIEAKGNQPSQGDWNIDESGSSYKMYLGFNFGIIPMLDLAVEGSYLDLSDATGTAANGGSSKVDVSGYDAFGLIGLSMGPFGLFAKAGVINWDTDLIVNGAKSSKSGTDGAYGVGARFSFSAFTIRAEYEIFDVSAVDTLALSSVSLLYTF